MNLKLFRDIDRSAGISCTATPAQGCPVHHNQDITHHERSTRFTQRPLRLPGPPQL